MDFLFVSGIPLTVRSPGTIKEDFNREYNPVKILQHIEDLYKKEKQLQVECE
jgi:hypothetical protein